MKLRYYNVLTADEGIVSHRMACCSKFVLSTFAGFVLLQIRQNDQQVVAVIEQILFSEDETVQDVN
jgi:hypothetical protein